MYISIFLLLYFFNLFLILLFLLMPKSIYIYILEKISKLIPTMAKAIKYIENTRTTKIGTLYLMFPFIVLYASILKIFSNNKKLVSSLSLKEVKIKNMCIIVLNYNYFLIFLTFIIRDINRLVQNFYIIYLILVTLIFKIISKKSKKKEEH